MSFIYFSEQEKQAANDSDIVSFLQRQGQEVKRCGREYMWDSPSGKVSIYGSEWYSQYERVGGGAVSFVQKFFDASYPNAIKALIEDASGQKINNKTYSYSRKERGKSSCQDHIARAKSGYAPPLRISFARKMPRPRSGSRVHSQRNPLRRRGQS